MQGQRYFGSLMQEKTIEPTILHSMCYRWQPSSGVNAPKVHAWGKMLFWRPKDFTCKINYKIS